MLKGLQIFLASLSAFSFLTCISACGHQDDVSALQASKVRGEPSVSPDVTTLIAMGRVRYLYPGYYSSTMGDFAITYKNLSLPWGTTVILKFGFKQDNHYQIADWVDQDSMQMQAVAPYTWEGKFERQIASRGGPRKTHLQFVAQILLPNDQILYDKGSDTPLGYYQTEAVPCDPSHGENYCEHPIQRVEKNY